MPRRGRETVLNGLTIVGSIVGTHHDLEEVFEYIDIFFNRRRRHSTLGMLCPPTSSRAH